MRMLLLALAVTVGVGAPAFGQGTPRNTQHEGTTEAPKMGTYDLELTTESGTLVGELSLAKQGTEVHATLTAAGNKPNVKSFAREGNKYVLTAGHGNFVVVYDLSFQRDSVFGAFTMSGGARTEGKVAGALRK